MAWTTADLDSLNAAIAEGVQEVKYEDKTVKYRSLSEMLQIRGIIRDELGLNAGTPTRGYPTFNKGNT